MISGKYILQTDFEEKNNSCKEIPGGKSFCIEEKYFSLLIVLEKKILHRQVVNVSRKNYITRGLGKKILNQTKSPIINPPPPSHHHHPPPSKSNARSLTKFSCIDGLPIAINRYGIRYKNLLAITSLHGNVTTIV